MRSLLQALSICVVLLNSSLRAEDTSQQHEVNTQAVADGVNIVCEKDQDHRTTEVVYAEKGKAVPCRVVYSKGKAATTIYSAQSRQGFCEEKAEAHKNSLVAKGFVCKNM